MRGKIALFTMLIIILNSVFVYADDDTVIISDDVLTNLQEEFEYNSETDTYYVPTSVPNAKSGTVAVSGACLSAILTLAVKAGLEFPGSNSMGEFLNRLFMIDGITSLVSEVEKVVSNSVGGILNFSRSLLDSAKSLFAEVMSSKNMGSMYYRGRKYVVKYGSAMSTSDRRYIFNNGKAIKTLSYSEIDKTSSTNKISVSTDIPFLTEKGTLYLDIYKSGTETINTKGYDTSNLSSYIYSSSARTLRDGYTYCWVPYIEITDTNTPYLMLLLCEIDAATGYYVYSYVIQASKSIPREYMGKDFALPTIGDAWSGSIPGNKDDTSSDLDIKIPSDMNSLVGVPSSGVTSAPSYEFWTPGTVVTVPSVDTGFDSVIDVPSYDVVNPPSVDDVPDDGTDTDSPSVPSLNLDWLKELIQAIIDLIKSIVDWLSNFWTHLWEFLKSLLVPGETYFVDEFGKVTEKMKEKIPSIDITKLEDLAVGEFKFKDIYAKFFGIECLVVRGSLINSVISWARPIIQGLVALFLLLYNYNQIYVLIRGTSLLGATNTIDNMDKNRVGGRR